MDFAGYCCRCAEKVVSLRCKIIIAIPMKRTGKVAAATSSNANGEAYNSAKARTKIKSKSKPKLKTKAKSAAGGNGKQAKLSNVVKPDGMSLEQWQKALRVQAAREESFGVEEVEEKLSVGEYIVNSPKSKQAYKVVYRGEASSWNYCSCYDFKTAQLGTCKHLEAVKLWIDGKRRRRVHREIPPYTSVYLSYKNGRKVCIRIGTEHEEEYRELARKYFDAEGVMLDDTYQHIEAILHSRK